MTGLRRESHRPITRLAIALVAALGLWLLWVSGVSAATTVVSPNGGECLTVGVAYTVDPDYDSDHVALYYRTDGLQPTHLDSSTIKHPFKKDTWNWTPDSDDISEMGRIWVDGHLTNHVSTNTWDSSDADFAVREDCTGGGGNGDGSPPQSGGGGIIAYRPEVNITSPKRGESFKSKITITYEATDENDALGQTSFGLGKNPVSIFYSESVITGRKKLIAKNLPASGSYTWNIKGVSDGAYVITVEATDNSKEIGRDFSGVFSINKAAPVIKTYSSGAEISWITETLSYSFIEYGKESNVYTLKTDFDRVPTKDHFAFIDNLEAGTTYYLRVVKGQTFEDIEESVEYIFSTPLSPLRVHNVFGVAGSSTTLISWINPPASRFSEIVIIRRADRFAKDLENGESIPKGGASYHRDAGLTNNTTYYYSIFTIGTDKKRSLPATISLTPQDTAPPAPTSPSAENTRTPLRLKNISSLPGENSIILNWKNPEDENFFGTWIVRNREALPSNSYDGTIVFRGRDETFKDSGLEAGKRYFYGFFAFNWEGDLSPAAFIVDIPLSPTTASLTPPTPSRPIDELKNFILEAAPKTAQSQIAKTQNEIEEFQTRLADQLKKLEALQEETDFIREVVGEGKIRTVRIFPNGFNPKTITVLLGDVVRWINYDTTKFSWPASNDLSTSNTTECNSLLFNPCRALWWGEEYSFGFYKSGTFRYHDFINPSRTGKVIVKRGYALQVLAEMIQSDITGTQNQLDKLDKLLIQQKKDLQQVQEQEENVHLLQKEEGEREEAQLSIQSEITKIQNALNVITQKFVQSQIEEIENLIKELPSLTEEELEALLSKVTEIQTKTQELPVITPIEETRIPEKTEEELPSAPEKPTHITKTLSLDMQDDEVALLQEILGKFPDIYPDNNVTGYFGQQTLEAVQRFQIKFSIVLPEEKAQIGYGLVGPKTRAMLNAARDADVHTITIEKNGFNPNTITIRQGDAVRWINNDTVAAWPGSDIHNTHGSYPDSGGCIESLFDACRGLEKGEDYYFIFNRIGAWGFHDHLEKTDIKTGGIIGGEVIVTP